MVEDFDEIVRNYQDRIFRLALSMLGDTAAAEETAQEVLVRVWRGLPGFRRDSSLSTWIYSITRNTCLTVLARGRLRTISLTEPVSQRAAEREAAAGWSAHSPPDAAALLNRLPAKYRTVVALFYMQEKSYDEVAQMLDIPVGTVKTYLFRARKSLAGQLARERVRKGGL